ncbi:uncharacterized protein LOC142258105 isoform X2 [Anomaloglossus baeobatrachus]|uniref:uncharacterized protein LOC142258105 isoform X2 n=1 Tax=Anomaloglossus baeobatrachus TaxID=238106 RepID=UPI003F50189B
MGVCCLHLCQESPNYGEKMASADLMEEDSTESFVEISDYDEILREEEQLQQQLHGEQSEENYGHKLAISPDVTCDCEIPVTPVDKGPAYREGILHEATDPAKITDHQEETPQSNTEDGPENSPEDDSSNNKVLHTACDTLGPGADVVQDIPAEPDTETANEGNPETQTVCDGYRSPGESIIDKSQHEEEASNEKTLASDNPELHSTETDKGASSESELQEENGQKSTCREESGSANRKEKMQDAQETKEVKKEQHDAQDEETQGSKDDALKGQKTHEDQEQPANKRCICEEQSLVIPRLDTTGHNQSSSLWSSRVDGVVSLRMEASGPAARRPLTVAQFFSEAVLRHGQKVALCVREADKWKKITYSEYGQQSRAVARGFLKGSLVSTLRDVHPTIFMGFPGLWEKVHRQWILVEKKATPLQKMTIGWARTKGLVCYTRTELAGCKSCENEDGFGLCLWGRHIFLGYLGKEQATSEAFTEDGWFITGHQQPLKMRQDVYEEL